MGADVSELNGVESLWFFSNAYKKFVHDAAEKWHKKNSQQDLVMRHLRGGPAPVMRRLSWKALLVKLREFSEMIEKPSSDSQLAGAVANLSAAMDEIKHRVRGKYPHLSKLL